MPVIFIPLGPLCFDFSEAPRYSCAVSFARDGEFVVVRFDFESQLLDAGLKEFRVVDPIRVVGQVVVVGISYVICCACSRSQYAKRPTMINEKILKSLISGADSGSESTSS